MNRILQVKTKRKVKYRIRYGVNNPYNVLLYIVNNKPKIYVPQWKKQS